jgi:hypothetical protein
MKCPKCRVWSEEATPSCPHCGIFFESYFRKEEKEARAQFEEDLIFGGGKLEKWAVPGAFLFSMLMDQVHFFKLIFFYVASIPFHEAGHAWIGVLGGRWVLPLGIIIPMAAVTQVGAEPSSVFLSLYAVLFMAGAYFSYKRGFSIGVMASISLFLALFGFHFFVSDRLFWILLLFGGVGGEFVLGTLGVSAFFIAPRSMPRWDFFRYPVLLLSSYAFVHSFLEWRAIASHRKALPSGSFLGDQGDLSGDLDRLKTVYGISEEAIVSACTALGNTGIAVIFTLVLFRWLKPSKGKRLERRSSLT